MVLRKDKIEELYIWVHPGNSVQDQQVLREWRKSILFVAQNPNAALVETSNTKMNVPYGIMTRMGQEGRTKNYLERVGELEDFAGDIMGARFFTWRHGNFIHGTQEHEEILKYRFNVTRREIDYCQGLNLFRFISCFGLEPRSCVEWQTYDCGLDNFAQDVGTHGLFLPELACLFS